MVEVLGNDNILKIIDLMKDKPPFPHTLLYGPPGSGKTTISEYIAKKCNNGEFFPLDSRNITQFHLSLVLQQANENSVILIDEIQDMPKRIMNILYDPMEKCSLSGERLQPFTIVGATTHLNKIPDALQRRFRLVKEVKSYSNKEIKQIIVGLNNIEEQAAMKLANMCRLTPGLARNFIELLDKLKKGDRIEIEDVELLQELQDIDYIGLTRLDRDYLLLLKTYGTLGLSTLSTQLQQEEGTLELKVEPFLLRLQLIIKQPRGRMITPRGIRYLNGENLLK